MKKLYIDVFDCTFYIYKASEKDKFEKEFRCEIEKGQYGCSCGNGIWISDELPKNAPDNIGVIFHEACHAVDWIIEERLCMVQGRLADNQELRAYLIEYIGNKIREYCCD